MPCRSLTNNMVVGLSEGYMRELKLIGVGYRAQSDGKNMTLYLGYSHTITLPIPSTIAVNVCRSFPASLPLPYVLLATPFAGSDV